MEDHQEDLLPQCNIVVHEDSSVAENFRSTTCPLCNSVLQLYQIHFDEKFLMCGKVDCPYPIGITDYHIYKIECNEEFLRSESRNSACCSSITSGSTISYADWTELDKSLQGDGPFGLACTPSPSLVEQPEDLEKLAKIKELEKNEDLLRKNVKKIIELNKQLLPSCEDSDSIDNEKWIKHIAQMEARSGVQLLKEHELKRVKTILPPIGVGELKLDIDSSGDTISLKIGVLNENK